MHHRFTRIITRTSAAVVLALLAAIAIDRAPTHAASTASSPLAATYDAHGGLDRWQSMHSLSYVLGGFPLSSQVARPNRSTVDLHTRSNRIEGEGFTVGWDGAQAWSVPGPDAVGLPPRLFLLGSFYFIGMPFVFADDGVILEETGSGTFAGKTYRVVNAGYEHGIGHSSKDDYTLFLDPETSRLALIHHSVTETGVERVTWVFNEWQEASGLLIPARMTFYSGWNPEDPGEGTAFTIKDVVFGTSAPDRALYAAPADGVIDQSPSVH